MAKRSKWCILSCFGLISFWLIRPMSFAGIPDDAGLIKPKHVIVVGVDGLGSYGLNHKQDLPNFDMMMKQGAWTLKARGVLPTVSVPNWMSIVTSALPMQHGVSSGSWVRGEDHLPPMQLGKEDLFPTIFSVLKQQRPQFKTGVFYHWEGFVDVFEKSCVHKSAHGESEDKTMELAIDYLQKERPEFLFIHLDHVDAAGHAHGHGTELYHQSVKKADELMGKLLEALKDSRLLEETVILVTSDHGGVGKGHGGESLAEIEVPFILYGKGIKSNYHIEHATFNFDTAATVAYLLDVQLPYSWLGRPIKGAMQGEARPVNSRLPDYDKLNPLFTPVGGLYRGDILKLAMATQDEIQGQGKIHYTLNGSIPGPHSKRYEGPLRLTKDALIKARVFTDKDAGRVVEANYRFISQESKPLVEYKYYEIDHISSMPRFEQLTPAKVGNVFEVDLLGFEHRSFDFAIQFSAILEVKIPGNYTFFLKSDDGSQLTIDQESVVENGGQHGFLEKSGEVFLSAGRHSLKVNYFQGGGRAELVLKVKGPNLPKQILSPSWVTK